MQPTAHEPEATTQAARRARDDRSLMLLGVLLLVGWLVIWMVPGVLFNGSVSQVHSLCSVPLFAGVHSSACHEANDATWVAWVMFGLGLGSLVRGAWRWHQSS